MKSKITYCLFILYLIPSFAYSAKDKYPISLKFKEEFQGAKLIKFAPNLLFKKDLSSDFTTLSLWNGDIKKNVTTSYLENFEVLDWNINDRDGKNYIDLLVKENGKYKIKEILSNSKDSKDYNLYDVFEFNNMPINRLIEFENFKIHICKVSTINFYFTIQIDKSIFVINGISKKLEKKIDDVNSFIFINNIIYFQRGLGTFSAIYEYKIGFEPKLITKIDCNESKCKLLNIIDNNKNILISINEFSQNVYLKTIDLSNLKEQVTWIETKINLFNPKDLISFTELANTNFTFIQKENDYSQIIQIHYKDISNPNLQKRFKLPEVLIEPISIYSNLEETVALFKNGLIILDKDFNITSYKIFPPIGERISNDVIYYISPKEIILSSKSGTIIFSKEKNKLWWFYKFLANQGYYAIPFISFLIILVFIQLYIRQRRLLNTIIQLPNTGFVLYFDKSGHLIKLNDLAMGILNITPDVPLNKYFAFYCSNVDVKPLLNIFEKGINFRENFNQKISIIKDNTLKDYICSIVILRGITGNLTGLLITGLDITEELERKRLSNWAQLAHDMQTNLSTIRLNAEQMEFDETSPDYIRRRKILHQSNLLIQRIRDIITVGRSESLNKTPIYSLEIMEEIKQDFDFDLYKNIEFEFNSSNFPLVCDKAKLSRALRNALENSIKIIKDNQGKISINAWYDTRYIYFSVKDNGPGMTNDVKEKMIKPFFTSGTGGTGIGTMIMQNVAVQHGGEIIISSELNKGTEVIFKLPNSNYRETL